MVKNKNFNPIMFLMPLGAGGLAIAFWVFLMFTVSHGAGMVHFDQVHTDSITAGQNILYSSVEVAAVVFGLIHFITLFYVLSKFLSWRKTDAYREYLNDPLRNNAIMIVFLAIDMAFNVVFALGNHFIFKNGDLFQLVMLPALIAWFVLFVISMYFSIKILSIMFTKEFDMNKMHFGFLAHPFSLVMIAVTGFGIAAFSGDFVIASVAFFLALMPLLVAMLLTLIKGVTMFQHHMRNNLPDRNFLPSTLMIMPIIMLIFLSLSRIGHYFHTHLGVEVGQMYFVFVTLIPFVFLNWYVIFGLVLIKNYFVNFKEFDVTQWAFICPVASYAVIGYFANASWLGAGTFLIWNFYLLAITILGAALYFYLLFKQIKANKIISN